MTALDNRLRDALHDLDERAAAHTARPRTATTPTADTTATKARARRRSRWLVPALAATAVAGVLVGVAIGFRPSATPKPIPAPAATRSTAAPSVAVTAGPSQSAAEARVWGIYPQVADLSLAERTARSPDDPAPVTTPEGVWQIARPDVSKFENTDDGCLAGRPTPATYRLCGSSYAEVLLLSPDRTRILRAYAFPEVPVQWIQVTPHAVYCGRTGDGAVPQSMLCRIDRRTATITGRLYACDGPDCAPWDPKGLATWPGTWSQGTEPISGGFDKVQLTAEDLVVKDTTGHVTAKVDPKSLRER